MAEVSEWFRLTFLLFISFLKTLRCHKVINDFLFLDSSSLLLTIGTSNDSYVLSIWDTLLPANKALIKSMTKKSRLVNKFWEVFKKFYFFLNSL